MVLISVFLAIGCSQQPAEDGEPEEMDGTDDGAPDIEDDVTLPQTDGQDVYNYIIEENNYKDWKLWPGTTQFSNGTEPHGELVTVYVSDRAYSAIDNKSEVMPNGSLIVKENYNPDRELQGLSLMYKVEGYDAVHNDWFWAVFGPDGNINAEGQVEACNNCHGIEENNDYLYTGSIRANITTENGSGNEPMENGETIEVEIENFEFKPSEVTISVGDTVKWTNLDSAIHNARQTIDNPELYSPNLGQGESFSHTFNEEGTYDYICTIHPYMDGTVIVE